MLTNKSWNLLGRASLKALPDARLQLHWAAQIVASVGKTYLKARPDDSHPNMGWNADLGVLAGHLTPHPTRFQAALRLADLTLLLLDEETKVLAGKPLNGCTLDEGFQWLEQAIRSSARASKKIVRPGYDLPSHGVSQGSPFQFEPSQAFEEISSWYDNAAQVFSVLSQQYPQASDVRCWPHHFDIATLMTLDPGKDSESARSVGIGMTPGDDQYPEPYWYVTPWPYPDDPGSIQLDGGGRWNTAGWTGAVLEASQITSSSRAKEQLQQVESFLRSAINGSLQSLGWSEG